MTIPTSVKKTYPQNSPQDRERLRHLNPPPPVHVVNVVVAAVTVVIVVIVLHVVVILVVLLVVVLPSIPLPRSTVPSIIFSLGSSIPSKCDLLAIFHP